MNNCQTNHFKSEEKEILDSLIIKSVPSTTPTQSSKNICSLQNDVQWDINAVLCYRYLHYQEPPFEPLTDGFVDHLKTCNYCQTFLSLPLNEACQAQQEHSKVLQVLRSPDGLMLMYKEMWKQCPAKSREEIYERRLPLALYRMLDAISVQNRLEFLLAMMRLKVARVLERFYFNQEQHEPNYQYPACSRPEYPHETADRIDLVFETLRNGTMNVPESLTDYFEHAITCETCQVSLSIPDSSQDQVLINAWTRKIKDERLSLVKAEKELLKGYARSDAEKEHLEELFQQALRNATAI